MTRILHLSDTHVSTTGVDMDGVDAIGSLRRMLFDARHLDLDLVVVSGDVADDGSVEGCRTVRDLVGSFAADLGIPHVYCTGNHDDRVAFSEVLGSGHLNPDGSERGILMDPDSDVRAAVSHVDGLRVVTLDSLVPGRSHGMVSAPQLAWLQAILATPSEAGTLVVVHHPPLRLPGVPGLNDAVLQNLDALATAMTGGDVRAVLCGHLHLQLAGSLAGAPVWVTPGVVTRIDLTAEPGLVRGVRGASASVVDLHDRDDGTPAAPACFVLHARDPRAGEQVYLYDLATGQDTHERDPG